MKRIWIFFLLAVLIFSGCAEQSPAEVPYSDVIRTYAAAGYHLEHCMSADGSYYSLRATNDKGGEISFRFYATAEEAKTATREEGWNVALWFVSLVSGDPTWVYTETYGNIAIFYDDPALYKVFRDMPKP